MMHFTKILKFSPAFLLCTLISCASNGKALTEENEATVTRTNHINSTTYTQTNSATNAASEPTLKNVDQTAILSSKNFSFTIPNSDWVLVEGSNNTTYEFYNAKREMRAVIVEINLEENQTNLMTRAQLEARSLESNAKILRNTEIYPERALKKDGVFFDVTGKRYDTQFETIGFITESNNSIYTLTLGSTSILQQKGELKKDWEEFFSAFKINEIKTHNEPEISIENVTSYTSELGYSWNVKDTLWHRWLSVENKNSDPDFVLTNKDEDVSMLIYGASLESSIVSKRDLFKVFLMRLGVDEDNKTLTERKVQIGDKLAQEFSFTHVVNKFDFYYTGRYFYEDGRALFIISWTQGATKNKYAKIMEKAIAGLKIEEKPLAPSEQSSKKQLKFNAALINQIGILRLTQDQPLVALSYFERANRLDMSEPLYLINCGFVYQMKELFGPGISHFESERELVQKNGKLLSILGEMYEAVFDYGHAREYAEKALQYTPNNPEYVINLSDALWGLGQRNQSLAVVQRLYDLQPSSRLGVYLAKTYMGLDQYAEAVDILYGARGRFGMSVELGETLMDALMFLGRLEEARAISEETIAKDKNNYRLWATQGKILFYSRNYRGAEKSLTRSLLLKADNEDAKSFLSATKAFLGKADNRTLQKPIEPSEERAKDLKSLLSQSAKVEGENGDYPAVIHFEKETLKAKKGENWVNTKESLIEILDMRGSAIFREFTFDFLPGFDRIYLNALEVYDSTWTLKQKASLNGAYITYATELGAQNEEQTAHFTLQDLEPGDFVYLQVSRTNLDNKSFIPYIDFKSGKNIPVGKSTFKIYADTARFVTEEYGPIERKNIKNGIEWQIENPTIVQKELYMPVYRDFGAGVLLTGKREWSDVGKDYQNLIKHQFKQAVSVREKAFEVRGSKIDTKAVQAIVKFVRNEIRYRDIRFGGHSLIPQTAEITLKERKGDCKDMALLLKEMLKAIGVKSYLAAIHLTENGFAHLPTIQQFNHMILYIPKQEKIDEMWVDATDKTGNDRPVPLDMEGKVALIIDDENSRIVTTPILEDNDEHRISIIHKLHIDKNGESEFRDSVILQGKFASVMRNRFYGRDLKEQEKLMEDFLSTGIPDVSIGSMHIQNIFDFDKPLILTVTYASKGFFGQNGAKLKGSFPNVWERSLFRLPKVSKRHHPIRIPHETHFSYNLIVSASNGSNVKITSPKELSRVPDYVSFEKRDNGIDWTTYALYADPSEYDKIREEWDYLLSETSPLIEIF